MPDETICYYDENVEAYDANTSNLHMSALYEPFVKQIPSGGKILDLGCGPGRDVVAFETLGYEVVGVDGSAAMVELARSRTSCPIHHMLFSELAWKEEFDGVWACASLLHVPRNELSIVLEHVQEALRPGGTAFVSFKLGERDRGSKGRMFTDLSAAQLGSVVDSGQGLDVASTWETVDIRPGRGDERWLNALLRAPILV